MQRIMLTAKLHRARVTATHMEYEGSIEIDENLLDAVDIRVHEQVHIYNISTGERFLTYVIPGKKASGSISINGAAARLAQINDRIIIAAYGMIDPDRNKHEAKVVLLDSNNKIIKNIDGNSGN